MKPEGDDAGVEPPPDNIIINGRHVSNCTLVSGKSPNCTAGSLYKTRIHTGNQVRLRLISHSTSTPFLYSIDNHTLEIVEIDGVEVTPIATTRIFMNPGQRYSVVVAANQTAGNYKMHVTAARSCFHMGVGTPSFSSVDYEAVGILSYDDIDMNATPIGKPWDLFEDTNAVTGTEPWERACRDLPFDLPKPVRKLDAFEVGAGNNHSFTFSRENVNSTVRTYINEVGHELWRLVGEVVANKADRHFTKLSRMTPCCGKRRNQLRLSRGWLRTGLLGRINLLWSRTTWTRGSRLLSTRML